MSALPILHRAAPLLFILAATSIAACSTSADDEEAITGDGTAESDFVSERQLTGMELPSKTVALTFDDGPGNRTSELANFLADRGIPATFFINGMRVPGRQGALTTIAARGHLIGNHTQDHKDLLTLSPDQIVREVAQTDAFLNEFQPGAPRLLRAPYGSWNGNVSRILNNSGLNYVGSVFWDAGGALTEHSAADWDCWGKNVPVDRCADLYMEEIRSKGRGIVLMHDIHDRSVDLIYRIVPMLQAEGYRFASLPQVPPIQRALAGAPAYHDQCASGTLGFAVDPQQCVQTRGSKQWWRCVAGEWNASSPSDGACKGFHPLPSEPVTVTWSPKSPTATYSLDVQASNGSWSAPCFGDTVLHQNLSVVLDGTCPSNRQAINTNMMKSLRLCWAENSDWGTAHCEETPYHGESNVHIGY